MATPLLFGDYMKYIILLLLLTSCVSVDFNRDRKPILKCTYECSSEISGKLRCVPRCGREE